MSNGKYVDYYKFNSGKVDELLKSKDLNDKLDGLLFTVLGSGDYGKSDRLVFEFSQSTDETLRRNAVLCIGHLARIHKKINLERYAPILDSIIKDPNQDEALIAQAEDTLNDIWIFCDKKEIKELENETCVSRFLQTLVISHDSESEKTYKEGIRKIKELREKETNPSVRNIQDSSTTYLSHFV